MNEFMKINRYVFHGIIIVRDIFQSHKWQSKKKKKQQIMSSSFSEKMGGPIPVQIMQIFQFKVKPY